MCRAGVHTGRGPEKSAAVDSGGYTDGGEGTEGGICAMGVCVGPVSAPAGAGEERR